MSALTTALRSLILACMLFYVCCTLAGGSPGVHALSRTEAAVSLPLSVSVWLLWDPPTHAAEDGTISEDEELLAQELEQGLASILPYYTAAAPAHAGADSKSQVQLELSYHVVSPSHSSSGGSAPTLLAFQEAFLREYRALIKSSPHDALGRHAVEVSRVSALLARFAMRAADVDMSSATATDDAASPGVGVPVELVRSSLFHLPVILIPKRNSRSREASQASAYTYTLVDEETGVCSQSVVADVAFYDQNAEACDLLGQLSRAQAEDSSATSTAGSGRGSASASRSGSGSGRDISDALYLPVSSLHHYRQHMVSFEESDAVVQRQMRREMDRAAEAGEGGTSADAAAYARRHISSTVGASAVRSLTLRTAAVVTSAVQAFGTAGSLVSNPKLLRAAGTVLVPVIVLRGAEGEPLGVDTAGIQAWVQQLLLPDQKVVVLTHEHTLVEHPQLAVAVASSRRSFIADSKGNSDARSGDGDGESEGRRDRDVPYIDSAALMKELRSSGDPLCAALLHRAGMSRLWESEASDQGDWYRRKKPVGDGTDPKNLIWQWLQERGHGRELNEPVPQTAAGIAAAGAETAAAAASAGGRSSSSSGSRSDSSGAESSVAVLPVFILEDVLTSVSVSSASASPQRRKQTKPVMPLLDKDHHVRVHDTAVIITHSSGPEGLREGENGQDEGEGGRYNGAHTYNRGSGKWTEASTRDASLLVAAAVAEALTGVKAPYMQTVGGQGVGQGQRGGRGVVDFTWSTGAHPFELGSLDLASAAPPARTAGDLGMYAWLGKRSVLSSRLDRVIRSARWLVHQARVDAEAVRSALSMLHMDIGGSAAAKAGGHVSAIAKLLQAQPQARGQGVVRGLPIFTARELEDALDAYAQANLQFRRSTSTEGQGGDKGKAGFEDAALQALLKHVVSILRSAEAVEGSMDALTQAFENEAGSRRKQLQGVLTRGSTDTPLVAGGVPPPPSRSRGRGGDVSNHLTHSLNQQYQTRHHTPFERVYRSLSVAENKLAVKESFHAKMHRSLYQQLATCTAEFRFVDNAAYSSAPAAGAAGHGMVADFKGVVERTERELPPATYTGGASARGKESGYDITAWVMLRDYLTGRSHKDSSPAAERRRSQDKLDREKSDHLERVLQGYEYDVGHSGDGHLAERRAASSGSSFVLRTIQESSYGRPLLLVLMLLCLGAVPLYLQRSRILLEKQAKKVA